MKKLNKLFLAAAVLLTATFASCSSDDDFAAGPQSPATAVTFTDATVGTVTTTPVQAAEVVLGLKRSTADLTAMDIPVNVVRNDSNICKVPAVAHFEKDSTNATLTVTFPDAELGKDYKLILAIDKAYANQYANSTIQRTVKRDHDWENLSGELTDGYFGKTFTELTIQHAMDDTTLYRVVKPFYGAFEKADEAATYSAPYLNFKISAEANDSTVTYETFKVGSYDNEGTPVQIYAYWKNDASLPEARQAKAAAGVSKLLNEKTVQLEPYYFIPALGGGFGIIPLTITLSEGKFK